jgi:hypothetical protein
MLVGGRIDSAGRLSGVSELDPSGVGRISDARPSLADCRHWSQSLRNRTTVVAELLHLLDFGDERRRALPDGIPRTVHRTHGGTQFHLVTRSGRSDPRKSIHFSTVCAAEVR